MAQESLSSPQQKAIPRDRLTTASAESDNHEYLRPLKRREFSLQVNRVLQAGGIPALDRNIISDEFTIPSKLFSDLLSVTVLVIVYFIELSLC